MIGKMERHPIQWTIMAIYIVGANLLANYCVKTKASTLKAGLLGFAWGGFSLILLSIGAIATKLSGLDIFDNVFLLLTASILVIVLPGFLCVAKVKVSSD